MSVRNSLLAVLTLGRCYGFQLKSEFEHRTGGLWPVNVGQVYTTLDRLVRDKLASKSDAAVDGRAFFEITDAGRAEVARWFSFPVDPASAVRDELAIKYAVATTLAAQLAVGALDAQQRWVAEQLLELRARISDIDEGSAEAAVLHSGLEARLTALEAEQAWIALQRARPAGAPWPLGDETPKRGRPARLRVEE